MTISEILNLQTDRLMERCPDIPREQLYIIAETGLNLLIENGEEFGIKRERMLDFLQEEAV